MPQTLRIDVWSDYVCPFCYLEMPVLERLRREREGEVAVAWRAFELRPEPVPTLDPDGEYLHRVWNRSVYPMARERGMVLRLPPVQPRSRKAFEAAAFAGEAGRFDAMHEALFRAFFEHGRDIGDTAVLREVGASVGLDPDRLGEALAEGRHAAGVLADERMAAEIGVTGVPAMLLSRPGGGGQASCSAARCPTPRSRRPWSERSPSPAADRLVLRCGQGRPSVPALPPRLRRWQGAADPPGRTRWTCRSDGVQRRSSAPLAWPPPHRRGRRRSAWSSRRRSTPRARCWAT